MIQVTRSAIEFSSSFEIFDCFFGPGRSATCSITREEATFAVETLQELWDVIMTSATRRYGAPYLQSICSSGGSGCSFPHPSHINQYASPPSDTARLDPSQPLAMIVSPTISTRA
jgi:hypothetical protein